MKRSDFSKIHEAAGKAISEAPTASFSRSIILGLLLAGPWLSESALAQSSKAEPGVPMSAPRASGAAAAGTSKVSPYHTERLTPKARTHYVATWGVDKLRVSYTSSGNLIRFSYRVANTEGAKALTDKSAAPYLVGQKNNVALQVPVMDMVGQLRQTAPPQAGQEYWMVFSNKGNLIRPGDRVNVIIGHFHADGLVVE